MPHVKQIKGLDDTLNDIIASVIGSQIEDIVAEQMQDITPSESLIKKDENGYYIEVEEE